MLLTQKNLQTLDQKSQKSQKSNIQTSIQPKQASSQARSSKTISSVCQTLTPEMQSKIKEIYSKLDRGKINPKQAEKIMEEQIGIKINNELARSLNKVDSKFKDIWNNIEKSKQINIIPTEKPTMINPHNNSLHIKGYQDNLPRYQTKRLNVKNTEEKNQKKQELIELCQQVCNGKEIPNAFIKKLKDNNIELNELTHELKELSASSQVPFNQLSSKLFRAIDNQENQFQYDKPLVHQDQKILKEYYSNRNQLEQNYSSRKPETSEVIADSQHKYESAYQTFHQPTNLNPFFSDNQFAILSTKKKMDVQSTKAMQNNGNIITWKNPKQINVSKQHQMKEEKNVSRVKSSYQMSPDKWKSKFTLNHSEAIEIAPKSTKARNLRDFQGAGDIISWNNNKIY